MGSETLLDVLSVHGHGSAGPRRHSIRHIRRMAGVRDSNEEFEGKDDCDPRNLRAITILMSMIMVQERLK